MKVRVQTASFSMYLFDSEKMTWKRHNSRPEANVLMYGEEHLEGTLIEWPEFKIGESVHFHDPKYTYIHTTPIRVIELLEE